MTQIKVTTGQWMAKTWPTHTEKYTIKGPVYNKVQQFKRSAAGIPIESQNSTQPRQDKNKMHFPELFIQNSN